MRNIVNVSLIITSAIWCRPEGLSIILEFHITAEEAQECEINLHLYEYYCTSSSYSLAKSKTDVSLMRAVVWKHANFNFNTNVNFVYKWRRRRRRRQTIMYLKTFVQTTIWINLLAIAFTSLLCVCHRTGIVHPKMKIMSLITEPHVIPRPLFIFWTQIKIFLMKSKSFLTLHRQQCNWNVPRPRNVVRTSVK